MKLFVIEGVDGAGKSTQIKLLKEYFSGRGYKCEYLHFPRTDAPWFGELIARFLRGEFGSLDDVDPYLVAMLYAGDRKDAADIIINWLAMGKIVLLDRYTYSNIAYQCAKIDSSDEQDKLMKWILSLEFNHFSIPRPDLNIFLDVPRYFTEKKLSGSRTGEDRTYLNGTRDIHEDSLEFQRKVRDIYLRVAIGDERQAVVDCSNEKGDMLPPDEIFSMIKQLIISRKLIT
ncbi:MAG: dTMP kinase [Bacteroidetes bacterium GWE2_41_25]|nr:MAG: dTMP kinase [Bacteroidetes bacterium GWA2_40_15]OFX85845.1 MAG: dTMP kinase [Bacteroidetes bacterium GWC2_40_22]OFX97444.1 MAG: dTMP kinase [Bacteroidetes bacterium GWE2_41_25]OFY58662.1 MAG: dTMP kinase [Bacteroidetes bacterium GWF2_41_9]HAM09431.1 dTMP kinase [Bacteroidales bacterium]